MRPVYSRAGIDARTRRLHFFEAHGTGTRAGDPIEARAIHDCFFIGHEPGPTLPGPGLSDSKLPVGSLKTVMGHLERAVGIAGLLKASLVLQDRETLSARRGAHPPWLPPASALASTPASSAASAPAPPRPRPRPLWPHLYSRPARPPLSWASLITVVSTHI